jgi:glycosyltransferase involved in cell wall biosynthesis
MKILYVCADPSITPGSRGGGFTTHMGEIIRSLRKLGHEVTVLETTTEAAQESRETAAVRSRRRRALPRAIRVLGRDVLYCLHNLGFYSKVNSVLRERPDFDFVYERYCIYQSATSRAARKRGVPLILEFNASIDETKLTDGLGLRPLAAMVEKAVTGSADAVLTVSGVLRDELVRRGLPGEKIHVMHNAVNLDRFSPSISGDQVRQKFGFSRSHVVVGFVGGFSVWHGAHLLLEAAPLALAKNLNIRFLMVGGREGNQRFENFKKTAERTNLSEVFRFSGEVPSERVPEHIAAMDICIIPWATEYGSPTKTFEYMGMGKALVAPRVKALKEVLEHEESALLVDTGNVEQMARALITLASDGLMRETLGRNARKLVEEKYNWDRNAATTVEIARQMVEARKAGARRK